MQRVACAFFDGMRDAAALVAHPIDSFAHWIGQRQFIILDVLLKFILINRVEVSFRSLRLFLLLMLLLLLFLLQRFLNPCPSHFTGDDPFAVGMVFIFFQQSPVSFRSRIAFAEKLFIANFVPLLGLAVPGNGDGNRRFLFLIAALPL